MDLDSPANETMVRRALSVNFLQVLRPRTLALCVPIVGGPSWNQALAEEAVAILRLESGSGWWNAAHTGRDPDLAALHDRDEHRRMLVDLFDRAFPADVFAP